MDVYEKEVDQGEGLFVVATVDGRVHLRTLSSSGVNTVFSTLVDRNFDMGAARFCKITRDIYLFAATGGKM